MHVLQWVCAAVLGFNVLGMPEFMPLKEHMAKWRPWWQKKVEPVTLSVFDKFAIKFPWPTKKGPPKSVTPPPQSMQHNYYISPPQAAGVFGSGVGTTVGPIIIPPPQEEEGGGGSSGGNSGFSNGDSSGENRGSSTGGGGGRRPQYGGSSGGNGGSSCPSFNSNSMCETALGALTCRPCLHGNSKVTPAFGSTVCIHGTPIVCYKFSAELQFQPSLLCPPDTGTELVSEADAIAFNKCLGVSNFWVKPNPYNVCAVMTPDGTVTHFLLPTDCTGKKPGLCTSKIDP